MSITYQLFEVTSNSSHVVIPTDYSGQLTVLLRYPYPQDSFDGAPHHMSLLLRQALALQMSPTPSTGVSLVIENHNLLNIPLEVPTPPPAPRRSQSQGGREKPGGRSMAGPSTHGHSRQQTSSQMGLPEMIARGLLERGESLGINKTLMSAVSELRVSVLGPRRNHLLNLFTAQYSRLSCVTWSLPKPLLFYVPFD